MIYVIRRALVGLFFIFIGSYAGYWSIKLMDIQTSKGVETHSIDWKYGFVAMVLMAIAFAFIALGAIINFPKLLRRLSDWSDS